MMSEENKNSEIVDNFMYYFKTLVADDDAIKEEVYRIRHKVYCEELSFEPERSDRMEQDEFDSQSTFSTIQHKTSGLFAGCVRIIDLFEDDHVLPFEKYCSSSFTNAAIHPSKFERDSICEISRLAVLDRFRHIRPDCNNEAKGAAGNVFSFSETEKRCFPYIAISLYMSACATAHAIGKNHAFIMAEPRLIRGMSFYGIKFEQVGDFIDFHGQRALFYLNAEQFVQGLKPAYNKLYDHIVKTVESQVNKNKFNL